jgi:hypothetical protein
LIEKSKVGDTVPVTTETLHAKRAALVLEGFIDENGGGPRGCGYESGTRRRVSPCCVLMPKAAANLHAPFLIE